jgi:hypothetical protein
MVNYIKKIWKKFQNKRKLKKLEKLYKKRLDELKKRDPFIYKH